MTRSFDVIIVGAGAAGLMCAIEAGKRGRRVALVEHSARPGRKILISGGGRCNFTNLHCRPENFLSANPHFAKSALARYTPADFLSMVDRHRIPYHEKTLGQLFCDRSARDILEMLEEECRRAEVQLFLQARIHEIRHAGAFVAAFGDTELQAPSLVVATGGLSIPKAGATDFGYRIARQFGIRIQPCRPALVPLTFDSTDRARYADLAGLSTEVIASVPKQPGARRSSEQRFREKMLFTHHGLSGPAILQISSYWQPPEPLLLDLAPDQDLTSALRHPRSRRDLAAVRTALRTVLPNRLADRWLEIRFPGSPAAGSWTNQALAELERDLHRWEIQPAGTEGYEKAEVTAGGVDTAELSASTMESRRVPGLYFIGEAVDVTGHLGGFNFQWAWASGFCAGRAL